MPSSKYIDKSNEFVVEKKVTLVPRLNVSKNVVSYEQWCDQNSDHLFDIYTMLQEACRTTGRYVFDKETCSFESFCKLAYENSHKYKKHDRNYDSEEVDDETIVF